MSLRAKMITERIALWLITSGLIVTTIRFYVRTDDMIQSRPLIEARIMSLESKSAVQDDRWIRIEKWMDRIDRKLDRGGR